MLQVTSNTIDYTLQTKPAHDIRINKARFKDKVKGVYRKDFRIEKIFAFSFWESYIFQGDAAPMDSKILIPTILVPGYAN